MKLKRSTDSVIAGVCGGLAEEFGVESWKIRLLTVLAFLVTGCGLVLLAYIAAWILLPPPGATPNSRNP